MMIIYVSNHTSPINKNSSINSIMSYFNWKLHRMSRYLREDTGTTTSVVEAFLPACQYKVRG